MYKRSLLFSALALGLLCRCVPAFANDEPNDDHLGAGIHDVTDPELSSMRGRYVVGDNTVVYFGVEMITTFQTNTGQTLQGALTVGMNFSKNPNSPQVTFVPTVTITTPNAPLPTSSTVQSNVSRSVQSGGIANVGGFVQSVQIAGDNNAVANVTGLNIQNGNSAPNTSTSSSVSTAVTPDAPNAPAATSSSNNNSPQLANSTTQSSASVTSTGAMANTNSSTSTTTPTNGGNGTSNNTNTVASTNNNGVTSNTGVSTPTGKTATAGGSSVSVSYSNTSADITASVAGQGSASQFLHPGSLGQEIQLSTDNAVVTNQMIVSLVTQQLSSTEALSHTLAQSLNLSHLNGH